MAGTGWTWTYDTLPYTSRANPRTHPDLLATLGAICGLTPAPPATARVLEIGCADGGNLVSLAYVLPEARLVGIDASARQIDEGRATVAELGLDNLELRTADLMTVGAELGAFDYIVAHGVYSWVPAPVQERLLDVCRAHLAPHGVAYISYNVYPGWHGRESVREMMLYHTRRFHDPREKTGHARGLLDFLAETVPAANEAYAVLLKRTQADLGTLADAHFFHDLLEESNRPVYFHEFVDRLAGAGLRYLTEAEYWTTQLASVPERVAAVIDTLATTPLEREQYLDFWRNRGFRQSVLCRADAPATSAPPAIDVGRFLVASSLRPTERTADDPPAMERFASPGGIVLATDHDVVKAGLRRLGEVYPRAVAFPELLREACARAGRCAGPSDADSHALADTLRSCFATDLVELHSYRPRFVTEVSARPVASPVARHQLRTGRRISSLLHRTVDMDDAIGRLLLEHLDGTRDRDALRAVLLDAAHAGTLVFKEGATEVTDPSRIATLVAEALDRHLARLASHALLVG